jgi:hypothetical protein
MFYCEECREKNDWPKSLFMSCGPCELCGKSGSCYDVKSSKLPPAKVTKIEKPKWRYSKEHSCVTTSRPGIVEDSKIICDIPLCRRGLKDADEQGLLIAAAPELFQACKDMHKAMDLLLSWLIQKDIGFLPSKSGIPWKAFNEGFAAIAKATGIKKVITQDGEMHDNDVIKPSDVEKHADSCRCSDCYHVKNMNNEE